MENSDFPFKGPVHAEQPRNIPPWVTVGQFPKYFSWPSESGLRWLIFNAEKNGMNTAILRIGRRVLIDTSAYMAWMRSHEKEVK